MGGADQSRCSASGKQLRSAIYDLRLGTHEDRAFADLLDELVAVQAELAASTAKSS